MVLKSQRSIQVKKRMGVHFFVDCLFTDICLSIIGSIFSFRRNEPGDLDRSVNVMLQVCCSIFFFNSSVASWGAMSCLYVQILFIPNFQLQFDSIIHRAKVLVLIESLRQMYLIYVYSCIFPRFLNSRSEDWRFRLFKEFVRILEEFN